jgi:hypothetical protein
MKKLIYVLLLLVVAKFQAQPPSKWYNKFGGYGIDVSHAVEETFNKQYIMCGSTSSFGFGLHDAILTLVDSMGQKIWEKNYGGALTDIAKNIIINPVDSGFIFTGYTNSIGNGGYDIYLVRTDKNGNIIWEKSFGGFDWDFGDDLIFASDGNLIICGSTYNSKYGKSDAYVLKINSNSGNLIWEKKFGGFEDDEFKALKLTSDNFYIITGYTKSYADIKSDILLFKLNLNGDSILSKTFGSPNKNDFGCDIIVDDFNDYVISGGSETYSSGLLDAYVLKCTNAGSLVWTNNFGKPDLDEVMFRVCLTRNHQGMYAITYTTIDYSTYKKDPKVFSLADNGDYIFGTGFGQSEDEELFGMSNTKDKGYICSGYTKSYGSNNEDAFIIKFDSVFTFNGNVIGIEENFQTTSEKINVFPSILNEYNSLLLINTSSLDQFIIEVSDINGKVITRLNFDYNLQPKHVDFKGFTKGIYFITVENKSFKKHFKVIKSD